MQTCDLRHRVTCLAHRDVITGQLQPCDICAPQLPAVQAMMSDPETQKTIQPPTPGSPLITRKRPPTAP